MTDRVAVTDGRSARLFVLGQFVLIGLVVLLPDGTSWPSSPGLLLVTQVLEGLGLVLMLIAGIGLRRGLTALPLPNQHARLRTGGLYRFARHPIYSGLMLFAIGRTVDSRSIWTLISCSLLVGLINTKARWEEVRLSDRFPAYPAYALQTGRFLPRLHRFLPASIRGVSHRPGSDS